MFSLNFPMSCDIVAKKLTALLYDGFEQHMFAHFKQINNFACNRMCCSSISMVLVESYCFAIWFQPFCLKLLFCLNISVVCLKATDMLKYFNGVAWKLQFRLGISMVSLELLFCLSTSTILLYNYCQFSLVLLERDAFAWIFQWFCLETTLLVNDFNSLGLFEFCC